MGVVFSRIELRERKKWWEESGGAAPRLCFCFFSLSVVILIASTHPRPAAPNATSRQPWAQAGRFAGAPALRILMRLHTNAHMATSLLKEVESSNFVAHLTPMIAPMMAVVGTKKINLVDFRWAFIGGADDEQRTKEPLTVMLNYLLEDEPAALFTLYRQVWKRRLLLRPPPPLQLKVHCIYVHFCFSVFFPPSPPSSLAEFPCVASSANSATPWPTPSGSHLGRFASRR